MVNMIGVPVCRSRFRQSLNRLFRGDWWLHVTDGAEVIYVVSSFELKLK